MGHVTLTMLLSGMVYHPYAKTWYSPPVHKIWQL